MKNVAIIGCGAIAKNHAEALLDSPHAALKVVCDLLPDRAAKAAAAWKARAVTDYQAVLADPGVDVVHLCTPHYLHVPMALQALAAGKHVLTEKPMALTAVEGEQLVKAARESGKTVGVCFQNRFNQTAAHLKSVLDSGKLGRIKGARAFVTWHRDQAYYTADPWKGTLAQEGGGVLINQSIHTLDLLQWFLGPVAELKGTASQRLLEGLIEVEDTAEATLRFTSGATAIFYATNCHVVDSPISIDVEGENGSARLCEDLTISYSDGTTETVQESGRAAGVKSYWGIGHKLLIDSFYLALSGGSGKVIDAAEGLKAIRLLEAIYTSEKTRKWETIG